MTDPSRRDLALQAAPDYVAAIAVNALLLDHHWTVRVLVIVGAVFAVRRGEPGRWPVRASWRTA